MRVERYGTREALTAFSTPARQRPRFLTARFVPDSATTPALLAPPQLCCEDYHWWWRSYATSGSCSIYLFLHSVYYAYSKLQVPRPLPDIDR